MKTPPQLIFLILAATLIGACSEDGGGPASATPAPSGGGSANGAVTALPDSDLLRAAVREIVREELRDFIREARSHERTPGSANAAKAADQPAVDPKRNAEAVTQAGQIVDLALARKTWTMDDNMALIPHVARLTPEQRTALTEKLLGAINRQELKPVGAMPPL
jgi:hypothetical protein